MAWGVAVGAAIGAVSSAIGQAKANKFNKAEAQKSRDFQQAMFSSRYQMTMRDMELAGLNPILAYKQGGGNPSGGAVATGGNIGAAAVTGAASGANTALAMRRGDQELLKLKADTELTNRMSATEFSKQLLQRGQRNQINESIKLMQQTGRIRKGEESSARAQEKFYNSPLGQFLRQWELGRRSVWGGSGPSTRGKK